MNNALGDTKFDIIIDDGSHFQKDVIACFRNNFEKLNPGGVFPVEDVSTSYWQSHNGSYFCNNSFFAIFKKYLRLDTPTMMEYFKNLTDLLNYRYINSNLDSILKNNTAIQNKKLSKFDQYLVEWVDKIEFNDSVVVITKK